MKARAGLSKPGLAPSVLKGMVLTHHCISHLDNIVLNFKESHKVLIPPHDNHLEASLKYQMIRKNNFLLLPLHCTCPMWGSAHEWSARALGTRHLPGTLEFIQSHAPFLNRKNKAQRGKKKKRRRFGQYHTASWWQKQCKYSDRQIPAPGLCKNCIFPHLLCQKVSQHSFQRPGLPHNLLDKVSGLLISREPSAFCHKLHFLVHSKDTWLRFSPRLGPYLWQN